MRVPALLLLVLLVQIGWKGEQKFPLPPEAAEARVDSMAREYYRAKFAFYPAQATLRGVPGYDGSLSTFSDRSIFGFLAHIRHVTKQLSTMDEDSLSIAKWVEYKALLADAAAQEFMLVHLEVGRSRPDLYVDACADGIAALCLLRSRVPEPDLAPRLRMVPQVIRHARKNLGRPSLLHCRLASERLASLIRSLGIMREESPQDRQLINDSIAALWGFYAFIDSLALGADPAIDVSYDDFRVLLDTRNMISDSPEAIRTYAEAVLGKVNEELGLSAAAPSAEVVSIPRMELDAHVDSAWSLIRREHLVSLPQEPLAMRVGMAFLDMPDYARRLFGDMLCVDPWPVAEPGYLVPFFIAPRVRGPGLTPSGLVASEVIPGRHTQALFAAMTASPVSRMHRDIFAANGWALYSQELMAREGLGGNEALRAALERKRFFAAGTIAAVNLVLGEFDLEQAADFMVKETGISEAYAAELALEYAVEPEHPMSYIIGERDMNRIRDEVSRILGEDFSLKRFHDSLLACGRLPLYLLRQSAVSEAVGRQ